MICWIRILHPFFSSACRCLQPVYYLVVRQSGDCIECMGTSDNVVHAGLTPKYRDVECMGTSDNVVHAGLTPKYRDVENLCDMLTYKQVFPEILRGVPVQRYVRRYTPPTDEFEVDCFSLPTGEVVVMRPAPSPSIFRVITGEGEIQVDSMVDGEKAKEGDVFFMPANTQVTISACDHVSMQLYRAAVNSNACGTAVVGKRSQLQNTQTD